jgi:hypothetical protein
MVKERQAIGENRDKAKRVLHRINQARKRLSKNGSGSPAILHTAMDDRTKELVSALRQMEHGKAVMAKVLELLDDYTYQCEQRQKSGYTVSFSWGNGSTSSWG